MTSTKTLSSVMFEEIKAFYEDGAFCDVRVHSCRDDGSSHEVFLCHSLVIASVLPDLQPILLGCSEEIMTEVSVAGVHFAQVKRARDSIYTHLAGGKPPTGRVRGDWLRSFNLASPQQQQPYPKAGFFCQFF